MKIKERNSAPELNSKLIDSLEIKLKLKNNKTFKNVLG